MVKRSAVMTIAALVLVGVTGYGFSRIATGFLPIEDQGYMMALVQLPEGASLERTQKTLDKMFEIVRPMPGVSPGRQHRGRVGARQQLDPGQCRGLLHHPQRLKRARQGRGPAHSVQEPQPRI